MTLKAIISGGGIGGLATAAALAQRGWSVTVYESNPGLRVTGSGIYLWSNGLNVLRDIGAYDTVLQNPFWVQGVESRDEKDEVVFPSYVPEGLEILCVARSQLLEGLEQAARQSGVEIRTNEPVVRALADASFIFSNGDRVSADLAIGCDGSSSVVRRSLGLEQQHTRMPEGCLRTVVAGTQAELPEYQRGIGIETWNGARRLLVSPISDDKIYLALSCLEADETGRDKRIDGSWKKAFPKWGLPARPDRPEASALEHLLHRQVGTAGRPAVPAFWVMPRTCPTAQHRARRRHGHGQRHGPGRAHGTGQGRRATCPRPWPRGSRPCVR